MPLKRLADGQTKFVPQMEGPFSPAFYADIMRGKSYLKNAPYTSKTLSDATAYYPTSDKTYIPYGDYMKGKRAPRARVAPKKVAPKRKYTASATRLKPSLSNATHGIARLKRGSKFTTKNYGKSFSSGTKRQKLNRKTYGYTGRGKYSFSGMMAQYKNPAFWKGVKKGVQKGVGYGADFATYGANALAAGATVAAFAGQPEFLPLAAEAEFLAADARAVSNYVGRGMYSGGASKKNGLISGSASTMPRMRNLNDETGTLVVSHRERLSDVFAPADSGFHQDVFTVSPGIEKTFPWLSQIAANYEEYELMQCVFEYDGHSLVGINDTLEVQGSLIMATQMNVKDKAFRDRHEMERFPHASKCAQHGSMAHGVECDPRKISGDGHRYIRIGGLAKDEDARDFDHAKFTIGQYNTPTELYGKEIGQLFVFYTVKLIKPKISSGRGDAISTFRSFCSAPVSTRAFGRLANDTAQDAGNGMQVAARNSLPMTPSYDASNDLSMTFDPYVSGTFRITATVKSSTDITGSAVSVVAGGSATLVKSQLPLVAGAVLWYGTGNEAILMVDVQVRPRDLASSSLASIKITGLSTIDLVSSCLEITEINILEESSLTDQPELKLIG